MKKILVLLCAALLFAGCDVNKQQTKTKKNIVVTTTFINDIVDVLAKDKVEKHMLIQVGVDPHLFEAKSSDIEAIHKADLVLYSGLHLEAKLADIFEKMNKDGKSTIAVTEKIDKSKLLILEEDGESVVDPHYWFDIDLYKNSVEVVLANLINLDAENKEFYVKNYEEYTKQLDALKKRSFEKINEIPVERRFLITPHDAFQYFSKANNIEVKALQGVTTDSEISTKDVIDLVDFIFENKVKAIFVESTTPHKNIEAVKDALKAKKFEITIGKELYSDSLSDKEHNADTYIKMYDYNVNAIVEALK